MSEQKYIDLLQQASRNTGFFQTDDDAALIPTSTVISTDQFLEDTHFSWTHMSAEKLGRKAIVQALSDLAAMAVRPTAVLTSLAWNTTHEKFIESFIKGIEKACIEYSVSLVGGDITRSRGLFYADVVVTGHSAKPVSKTGAKPNDLVALSGTMGDARAGLECLSRHSDAKDLIFRYQEPKAYIDLALKIYEQTKIHAMTDISDSLSKSLFSIAKNSKVGFIIDDDLIPVSQSLRNYVLENNKSLEDYKWNSGEDYQLLMILSPETPAQLLTDFGLTVIGRATSGPQLYRVAHGKTQPLTEVGWDPFSL